jgi:FkbM family methyltransferase
MTPRQNWLDAIRRQIAFYTAAPARPRQDGEFAWDWFDSRYPAIAAPAIDPEPFSAAWVTAHAEPLWDARSLFADDASRLLFDAYLLIRAAGHHRYYVPRAEFEDLIEVRQMERFVHPALPVDYLGLPLHTFSATLCDHQDEFRFVSTELQVCLLNNFHQYILRRPGIVVAPLAGDVVFDCGACIGEFSLLFAVLAGPAGQVHMFDPIPLHLRYCHHQADLNPRLASRLRPNLLAVGDHCGEVLGSTADLPAISPGGLRIDTFATTSLDAYADRQGLASVDFVKMDIEGAELAALAGATGLLARHRPRLAVSAYHRPAHLWEVPQRIHALNPAYRLFFAHHTPIRWESVCYAL